MSLGLAVIFLPRSRYISLSYSVHYF